jgi:hypothetical protein
LDRDSWLLPLSPLLPAPLLALLSLPPHAVRAEMAIQALTRAVSRFKRNTFMQSLHVVF